jgi:hypothetical protein
MPPVWRRPATSRVVRARTARNLRTARVVSAPLGDGVQTRHGTVDLVQAFAVLRHVGDGGHQARCVGMGGHVDDFVHRADLGNAPGVHHGHAVTGLGDDAHVVGDQHDGGTVLGADVLQQTDDLRLHRHVQRRRGFVSHDQLGLGRQRQGNHHALAHAAGELVGIVVDALLGRGDAGVLQQADRARARLGCTHGQVRQNGFDQLLPDSVERVQRGQRILKDGADLAAPYVAHRRMIEVVDALAFEQDLPAGHPPGRLQQADDGRAGQRLARAGFTHDTEDLSRRDIKKMSSSARNVPRRPGNSTTRFLTCKRLIVLGPCLAQARVQRVAQPVTQQVDRQRDQHQHHAGEHRDPPFAREQIVVADADQRAQRRRRRRRTDAQE